MKDLLLVIDMQNVYLPEQPWACETAARTKENILKLLENHSKDQTIFTRYIAAEHPVGTWITYNEMNRKWTESRKLPNRTTSTTKARIPPFRYPPSAKPHKKPIALFSPVSSPNAVSFPPSSKASTSVAN